MSEKEDKCTLCGDTFDEEERENPRRDASDEPICDDCYTEDYQFRCCLCEDYGEQEDQHNLVLVLQADTIRMRSEDGYMSPGVYQVARTPYWCSDYFNAWVTWKALTWLCELPSDIDLERYPMGHLCLDCQNKLWERIGGCPVTFEKIEKDLPK